MEYSTLQFFEYQHLPDHLQKVGHLYSDMAYAVVNNCKQNYELNKALDNLLYSRDCALRSIEYDDTPELLALEALK